MHDVSKKEREEWIAFKEDVRKLCARKKIQIVNYDGEIDVHERDELAWVD
jgi:hypothetical protein